MGWQLITQVVLAGWAGFGQALPQLAHSGLQAVNQLLLAVEREVQGFEQILVKAGFDLQRLDARL